MNNTHPNISMLIFLSSYFLIYGGMHYYFYLRTKAAFPFHPKITFLFVFFMIFMVFAPVIMRLAEAAGLERIAGISAVAGFMWMGFLFLTVSLFFTCDVIRALMSLTGLIFRKNMLQWMPGYLFPWIFSIIVSLAVMVYGYFEAGTIKVKRFTLSSVKIPASVGKIKIVQISDVHLGIIVGDKKLKQIIEKVKKEQPDILVSTGDLVDGDICKLNGLSSMLKGIRTKYGKFAVTGNHEFYAGLENALCFTEESGFEILRGQFQSVDNLINIAGVDDDAGRVRHQTVEVSEKKLLEVLPKDVFTVFLKHRPVVAEETRGLFDLQLSGHTHGGQIFPFHFFTRMFFPRKVGVLHSLDKSYLYISRGTGTWGPPVRFLSPPEITVFEIVRAEDKSKVQ